MLTAVADPFHAVADTTVDSPSAADSAASTPTTSMTALVFAKDPISRAGVASQLLGVPDIDVMEPGAARQADVAIIVSDMVNDEVFRVIRTIRRGSPSHVVVVAGVLDTQAMLAAIEAGATGFLRRSLADQERLSHVVRKAKRGEPVLPPRLEERLLDRDERLDHAGGFSQPAAHRLSARDLEVLRLLADGCDTAEIAQRLAYSEPTIKNVIQRLFERLKVRNRPHAVAVALKTGII
jgi:DNA-binding NarL/FixJ family response regulator